MLKRIENLTEQTLKGERYFVPEVPEYDRTDLFLPPMMMSAKRSKDYILSQTPVLDKNQALTGYFLFSGDVAGDIFNRCGHKNWLQVCRNFYNKPMDGLCTFEWQHSVADFEKVIKIGIEGYRNEIAESRKNHTDPEKLEFLDALTVICDAIEGWAEKCAKAADAMAEKMLDDERKARMEKLAKALRRVPKYPASTFYEGILDIYIIFSFVPDSIGCIDRYLYPLYQRDMEEGVLNEEEARAYLQELFLTLQAKTPIESANFTRGGESHFCVGGYLENGEDGFNELSKLIVESMLELPTWAPQVSLRWTKKTPYEVFRFMMDCERKDPNKRIAFVSDEPRIKTLTEVAGFPYEVACKYTMVGCNEPQLPGGTFMGGCAVNIVKAIERTMFEREADIVKAGTFEEFYRIFEEELYGTMDKILYYYNRFQEVRSRDVNLVSTMFFEGSIDRAKSITQGGVKNAVADISVIGITTVIDSLAMVRQFVYNEKKVSMEELVSALKNNWAGYEELRDMILKRGQFFGNNQEVSDDCAKRYAESSAAYLKDKKSDLGYNYFLGNLIGYQPHNKFFGMETKATPDGRCDGDLISFGIGQSEGKDREGLTALLSSVAKLNGNHPVLGGDTVTNILVDEQMVMNDENFEKLVKLLETYFQLGGLHFQLSYVSREDLKQAKITPDKYRSLRVRVSGFSDYFVNLTESIQDEIIVRTKQVG